MKMGSKRRRMTHAWWPRVVKYPAGFERGESVFNLSVLPDEPLTNLCVAAGMLLDPTPTNVPIRIGSYGQTKYLSGTYYHWESVNMRWLQGKHYRNHEGDYYLCDGCVEVSLNIKHLYQDWWLPRLVKNVQGSQLCHHKREVSVEDVIIDQSMRYAGAVTRLVVHELAHASDDLAGLYFQSMDGSVGRRSNWHDREEEQRAEEAVKRLCGSDGINMGEYGEWLQPHQLLQDPMLEVAEAVEAFLWERMNNGETKAAASPPPSD
jgi:hypothetical protein